MSICKNTKSTGAAIIKLAGASVGTEMPTLAELIKTYNHDISYEKMSKILNEYKIMHTTTTGTTYLNDNIFKYFKLILDGNHKILIKLRMWDIPKTEHINRNYNIFNPFAHSWVYCYGYNVHYFNTLRLIDPRGPDFANGRDYCITEVVKALKNQEADIIIIA